MKKLEKLSLENIEILSEQETMYLMGGDGSNSTYVAPRDTTSQPVQITHSISGNIDRTPTGTRAKLGYSIEGKRSESKVKVTGYVDYGPGGWGYGGGITFTFPQK